MPPSPPPVNPAVPVTGELSDNPEIRCDPETSCIPDIPDHVDAPGNPTPRHPRAIITPRMPDPRINVNVGAESHGQEFLQLVGGAAILLLIFYAITTAAIELAVEYLPEGVEHRMGQHLLSGLSKESRAERENRAHDLDPAIQAQMNHLQGVVDRLTKAEGKPAVRYTLHLINKKMVNALALPGHHIVLFTGLLKRLEKSPDALAFVIAHEMGHFAHRDHLRGMGWRLVTGALGMITPALGDTLGSWSLGAVVLRYSRQQEQAADLWALDLLHRAGMPLGGAITFMETIVQEEQKEQSATASRLGGYLSSHPQPVERLEELRQRIATIKTRPGTL